MNLMSMRAARRSGLGLAVMLSLLLGSGKSAYAYHLLVVRDRTLERSTSDGGWVTLPVPIHRPIDGIAYDPSRRGYAISFGAPGPCSFAEFRGPRLIARLTPTQFRRASHTSMIPDCALHTDPAGGVVVSAGFGTLGSATSWSVNLVSRRAVALGYGYAATTDGHHVVLVQHTYFPSPNIGSAELLAAGEFGQPDTARPIVPVSQRFGYAAPALSAIGERLAVLRDTTLLSGRLGSTLRPIRRLPKAGAAYDLQWSGSGQRLILLAGPEGGAAGTLSQIDPGDGRRQVLTTGVSSFAVIP